MQTERFGSTASGMTAYLAAHKSGLLAFVCLTALAGQTAPGTQPTFSVGVNLVRLLVSVHGASGGPVTDLNKQDFRIMDSGVPQQIAVLAMSLRANNLHCARNYCPSPG